MFKIFSTYISKIQRLEVSGAVREIYTVYIYIYDISRLRVKRDIPYNEPVEIETGYFQTLIPRAVLLRLHTIA
jgi:hypothetical protein